MRTRHKSSTLFTILIIAAASPGMPQGSATPGGGGAHSLFVGPSTMIDHTTNHFDLRYRRRADRQADSTTVEPLLDACARLRLGRRVFVQAGMSFDHVDTFGLWRVALLFKLSSPPRFRRPLEAAGAPTQSGR
jgi:hypothetical protein